MSNEEFKFPDEQPADAPAEKVEEKPEFDIVVEDDTPPQDRGRAPMPKEVVEELDKDDLEEYSEKVKKRLGQMKKVWHDERREKESAQREKEEALRFAQAQLEENKRLKQRLGTGEKAYIHEVTKSAAAELAAAKEKLTKAYESGNAEELAAANEALTEAKLRSKEVERIRPSLQETETSVQTPPQAGQPAAVDPRAAKWQQDNRWFGTDEEMTALALGLHEKLVRAGVDPRSDEYYDTINKTIRKRFPENFSDTQEEPEKVAPRAKPANVVAPVTRSTAPKQVRLTASALALAKKFGLSPEQYAREVMKLETNNG
jgi:hypothetical protein